MPFAPSPVDQFGTDRPQMSKESSMKDEDPGAKIGFWLLPLNQQNQQQMVPNNGL